MEIRRKLVTLYYITSGTSKSLTPPQRKKINNSKKQKYLNGVEWTGRYYTVYNYNRLLLIIVDEEQVIE